MRTSILHKQFPVVILIAIICLFSCTGHRRPIIRGDFVKYYSAYKVNGSFALYDPIDDQYTLYNPSQFDKQYTPASTFKICNSLIGLETNVIADASFVIPWDSVVRHRPEWNKDQDLKTAYANSTVWYYQELARRVGDKEMYRWLRKAGYGNADTSGGIDQFWLTGGLRITPRLQIGFLQRLHNENLAFSKRSMNIVKEIMINEQTKNYTIRAKTGWGMDGDENIGWFVGYVENAKGVFYFSNCIQSPDPAPQEFGACRKEIAMSILRELKIIP